MVGQESDIEGTGAGTSNRRPRVINPDLYGHAGHVCGAVDRTGGVGLEEKRSLTE